MNQFFPILNAFIEDTCVLVVIAYLMARGRMLELLSGDTKGRKGALLGLLLGLVGCTEVIFPGLRFPYVLHTLIVSFATMLGGIRAGLIAVATVLLGVALLQEFAPAVFVARNVVLLGVTLLQAPPGLLATAVMLTVSVLVSAVIRQLTRHSNSLPISLLTGMGAQTAVILLQPVPAMIVDRLTLLHWLACIPANGFGLLLLQLVVRDARTRAASERYRLEAERAHALAAEAQLGALRARVHPHFLFNALTSIAALCGIAPDKAEHAIIRLSLLMRCALQADMSRPQSLREEIDYTRAYLEIEQYRLGTRLQTVWNIEPQCEDALVPPFALQTLVENAIGHGIAPRPGIGHLQIHAHARRNRIVIAVQDDGAGIEPSARHTLFDHADGPPHGLQIVSQQLILLYGRRARPRILSQLDRGTLVAFAVPYSRPLAGVQPMPKGQLTDA